MSASRPSHKVALHSLRADTGHLASLGLLAFLGMSGFVLSMPRGSMPSDLPWFIDTARRLSAGLNPYVAENPNLNPPTAFPLYLFLASVDNPYLVWIWLAAGLAAYGIALTILIRAYLPHPTILQVLWPLSIAPLWQMAIALGNIYPLLCLLMVIVMLALERKRIVMAGALLGLLVAIKPNFAVLLILLFVAGHRRCAVWCGVSALSFVLLPIISFGPRPFLQWLDVVRGPGWYAAASNLSLYGAAARAGVPWLGVLVSAVAGLVAIWFFATRRPDALTTSLAGIALGLLISPLAWPGYVLLLLPVFFWRPWTLPIKAAAVLITVPAYTFTWVWRVLPDAFSLTGLVYLVVVTMVLLETIRHYRWAATSTSPDRTVT